MPRRLVVRVGDRCAAAVHTRILLPLWYDHPARLSDRHLLPDGKHVNAHRMSARELLSDSIGEQHDAVQRRLRVQQRRTGCPLCAVYGRLLLPHRLDRCAPLSCGLPLSEQRHERAAALSLRQLLQ